MHQEHEKEEREKQRSKAEVDRLRGLVSGTSSPSVKASVPGSSKPRTPGSAPQASVAERKKQMAQLAEMGIAVPNEYRGELALAGEWQTLSERSVQNPENVVSSGPRSVGVRKRKLEDEDEDEAQSAAHTARKGWGSTTKVYPGSAHASNAALDDLLSGNLAVKKESTSNSGTDELKSSPVLEGKSAKLSEDEMPPVKKELDDLEIAKAEDTHQLAEDATPAVVFKKRKPKFAKNG